MGRQFVGIAALVAVFLVVEFTPSCNARTLAKGKGRISKQDNEISHPPSSPPLSSDSSDNSLPDDSTHDSINSDDKCKDEKNYINLLLYILWNYSNDYSPAYSPDETTTVSQRRAEKSELLSLTRRLAAAAKKNLKVKDGSVDECKDLQWVIGHLLYILNGGETGGEFSDGSPEITTESPSPPSDEQSQLASRLIAVAKKNHKFATAIKGKHSAKKTSAEKIEHLTSFLNKLDKKH